MSKCNFLLSKASGNTVKQSDVEELEAKLLSLVLKVSEMEQTVINNNFSGLNYILVN
jgi:hypothetical protein